MQSYKNMLKHVMENGVPSNDRTGVGTLKVFGYQFRHPMERGFPLLTSKRMSPRIVFTELCWMMKGMTNIRFLQNNDVTIWDEWADENGDLGRVYGAQWRDFGGHDGVDGNEDPVRHDGVDQIKEVFASLQNNPDGRRHIVTAWNPMDLPGMKLPPCHLMFQFGHMSGYLHLHMIQRSADLFLGVPYNIAFYGALLHLFAHCLGMTPGDLVISFSDLHIYKNHVNQVMTQLCRKCHPLPKLFIDGGVTVPWDIQISDFDLTGYTPEPKIEAPVAV